jgi:hypothetical protein
VFWLGFNGIAMRTVIVAFVTLPLLLRTARRLVPIRPLRQIARPAVVAAACALGEFGMIHVLPPVPTSFVMTVLCGVAAYVLLIAHVEREVLRALLHAVLPERLLAPLRWYMTEVAPTP